MYDITTCDLCDLCLCASEVAFNPLPAVAFFVVTLTFYLVNQLGIIIPHNVGMLCTDYFRDQSHVAWTL